MVWVVLGAGRSFVKWGHWEAFTGGIRQCSCNPVPLSWQKHAVRKGAGLACPPIPLCFCSGCVVWFHMTPNKMHCPSATLTRAQTNWGHSTLDSENYKTVSYINLLYFSPSLSSHCCFWVLLLLLFFFVWLFLQYNTGYYLPVLFDSIPWNPGLSQWHTSSVFIFFKTRSY